MKNRINFYSAEFAPRLDLLSLTSVLLAWGATLTVLLLIWAGVAWYGASKRTELAVVQDQQQQLSATVNNLKAFKSAVQSRTIITKLNHRFRKA